MTEPTTKEQDRKAAEEIVKDWCDGAEKFMPQYAPISPKDRQELAELHASRIARHMQAEREALRAVDDALRQSAMGDLVDADDANPDAHIEITLSVAEAKAVRQALKGTSDE